MTASSSDTVTILMALFNGAKNLAAQLDSYADQTHFQWQLQVSDDGSSDTGPQIIEAFAKAHPKRDIQLLQGPRKGFVQNFFFLLQQTDPQTPFVALSDQDDVWLKNKLETALGVLKTVPDTQPALYCARTYICDDTLQTDTMSVLFSKPPSFENALVQNIGGGNTMVLNKAALTLLQAASPRATQTVCHDWFIYQMVAGAGGAVFYDPDPCLKYRQHGHNLIGANNTKRASLQRVHMLFTGHFKDWNTRNIAALQACADLLTPKNQTLLAQFAQARNAKGLKGLRALRKCGIYRQTRSGQWALMMAALLGKV